MARERDSDIERFDDESPALVPDHVEVTEQLAVEEPVDTAESVQADNETSAVTVSLAEGVEGPVYLSLPLPAAQVPERVTDEDGRVVIEGSTELPVAVAKLAVQTRKVVAD